jgi:hypothetical protein
MGLFDKIFKKKNVTPIIQTEPILPVPIKKPRAKKKKVSTETTAKANNKQKKKVEFDPIPKLTSKEIEKAEATQKGEPWVSVLDFEINIDNLSDGSFELDWNEIFIAKLIRAGYAGKTDHDIVDLWFSDVCRNIIQENFEQAMSDPLNRSEKGREY